jgi:Uma2 family endonuclease
MVPTTLRRRFTVEEYHRMGAVGILSPGDRVELIEGEIVQMSPIGSKHAAFVDFLTRVFSTGVGRRAIVRVQSPVRIGDASEPQPDLMLLKPKIDFYASGHPGPGEVLLLIEVADSFAESDRVIKLPMYAGAGIGEAWLVDMDERRIEVYWNPQGHAYASSRIYSRRTSVSPQAFPDMRVSIDELP